MPASDSLRRAAAELTQFDKFTPLFAPSVTLFLLVLKFCGDGVKIKLKYLYLYFHYDISQPANFRSMPAGAPRKRRILHFSGHCAIIKRYYGITGKKDGFAV